MRLLRIAIFPVVSVVRFAPESNGEFVGVVVWGSGGMHP